MRRKWLLVIFNLATVGSGIAAWQVVQQSQPSAFDPIRSTWVPYGGTWEREGETFLSKSDERGARLMSGSMRWRDYKVDVDLALLGAYGNAVVIVRGRDSEKGNGAYSGFAAGLRSRDNTLLLGRSDFGWEEYRNRPLPDGIQIGQLYHLRIVVVGCKIAARIDLPDGRFVREGVEPQSCVPSGQIGLLSYQTPAVWKNLHISPASEVDVERLMQGEPLGSKEKRNLNVFTWSNSIQPIRREALSHAIEGTPTPISNLALTLLSPAKPVFVRGTVTLLSPLTYVEDTTGGVVIQPHDSPLLAIGDDVEVNGFPLGEADHITLRNARVRVLSSNTPPVPRMITASQASSGAEDGHSVVINGVLRSTWKHAQQTILELESNGVVFRALAEPQRYSSDLSSLRIGSELMLSGVIRSDDALAGDGAFAVLLSPTQDAARVVHQPPWWNATHIAIVAAALICLIIATLLGYGRIRELYLMHTVQERQLLADDLHDTIAQSFAGIGFQLRAVEEQLSTNETGREQLERAQVMLRNGHHELRQSIISLRVQIGSSAELATALETSALRLVKGGSLNVLCTHDGTTRGLPPRIADCFFRVAQEAIANAIQHGGASTLRIALSVQPRYISLSVNDDGIGLPGKATTSGGGLSGMRRRAEAIGAQLTIDTSPSGTTILLETVLPHHVHLVTRALQTRWTSQKGPIA
jgi:signal transduction histidine kinase